MSIKTDAADSWFSKCVRKRANWKCEACTRTETLQCAHVYGRREKSVRWDGMNALSLCHSCHRNFTENPLDFARFCLNRLGRAHMDLLNEKRQHKLKTTAALRKEMPRVCA